MINKEEYVKKLFDITAPTIYKSKLDTSIIYAIYRNGLTILKYNNGSLKLVKDIPLNGDELAELVENIDGSLWIKRVCGVLVILGGVYLIFTTA